MTKHQIAQLRRDDWRLAVAEGRVVRHNDGLTFRKLATVEDAREFVEDCFANDDPGAHIVKDPEAEVRDDASGPDYCTGCGAPVGVSGCRCDQED